MRPASASGRRWRPGRRRPTHLTDASALHDHLCHLVFHDERGEPVEIGAVLRPAEGLERAREGARGSDSARPTRPCPRRRPAPGRRGDDSRRGGTFRCSGQPPLRSISLVSLVTGGGNPRLRSSSVVGWYVGCARPGRDAAARRNCGQFAPPSRRGRCPRGCTRLVRTSSTSRWRSQPPARRPATPRGSPRGRFRPLGDVGLAAAPAPDRRGALPASRSLADSPRERRGRVQCCHECHLATGLRREQDHRGRAARQPATDVEGQRPRSPPPRPAGEPVTRATPPTSFADEASCPAAASVCCPRSSASSLSASRSRASMPLTRSTRPSCGVFSRSASWRTRSRSRAR